MGVHVKIDLAKLKEKTSSAAFLKARRIVANESLAAMDKYVPYLEGNLSKQVYIAIDGSKLVYTMPYAKAQFYGLVGPKPGYPVKHWTTATHKLATKRWDLAMKGNKEDMEKIIDSYVKAMKWTNDN